MSKEQVEATVERGTVRNWTEEEKDIVWEQTTEAKENNLPLTEAFRRVSRLLPHRSEAAVGMLYYNVLRKEREEPQPKSTSTSPEVRVDSKLVEAFQGLPEYIRELNAKVRQLEQRLSEPEPSALISAFAQLVDTHASQADLEKKVAELAEENKALQETNLTLQANFDKLKQAYDDALGIYEMFTNMASISQIMSLGDFKQEMKTTLDKWGNVLKISFDRRI